MSFQQISERGDGPRAPQHRVQFHSLARGYPVVLVSFVERRHIVSKRNLTSESSSSRTPNVLIQGHTCNKYVD